MPPFSNITHINTGDLKVKGAPPPVTLSKISITFNTHDDDKDHDTALHVFVKNRLNNTSTPEAHSDYIGNKLAFDGFNDLYAQHGDVELNPYLGAATNLAPGVGFGDPSSNTFDIPLRLAPIYVDDVVLPVVNIHILPNGDDRWIFDYVITFTFSDGSTLPFASNTGGVAGIILDQDNRDYSGICTENTFNQQIPSTPQPATDAILTKVTLDFQTHNDDKNPDSQLNIHLVNRQSATSSKDIAVGINLLPNTHFDDPSTHTVVFSPKDNPLSSNAIRLQDMVLPVINIIMIQGDEDRWIFDYRITFEFTNTQTDGQVIVKTYSTLTKGIILDQTNNKYSGVYQGDPFPTVAPPTCPQPPSIPTVNPQTKTISVSYLRQRLGEFINNRQGVGNQDPPLNVIRLDNSGVFGGQCPESYADLEAIDTYDNKIVYDHATTSLNQIAIDKLLGIYAYLSNVRSTSLTVTVDPTQPAPLILTVTFGADDPTKGPPQIIGYNSGKGTASTATGAGGAIVGTLVGGPVGGLIGGALGASSEGLTADALNTDLTGFTITLKLTLDVVKFKIDAMSWADDPNAGDDDVYGKYISVNVNAGALSGLIESQIASQICSKLIGARDGINSTLNSWLLGGVVEGAADSITNCSVTSAQFQGDNWVVTYNGPERLYNPVPPQDWPTSTRANPAYDFSPGNLANIDHIVVLTMENRSFDQMLGYLSLPVEKGGMGRTEVDGLKGGEANTWNGNSYPSYQFPDGQTLFEPDPPHSHEPVARAINGGKMDGFVQSYGEEHGRGVAGTIMGYHTGTNVPTYDALARDFAICHRWFASHPGPTFCNRFYELTGRLNVAPNGFWEFSNTSPRIPAFTKTLFDHLTDHGVSWKYFENAYCFLRFFQKYTFDNKNIFSLTDQEFGFFAAASSGNLPSVTFIDPHFIELPPHGNCDGPPADVADGQTLVERIVEAVVASPAWSKTLLIITYDEHGGFFDHVPPPAAVKVSPESPIDTLGVRVPAFIISPWISAGVVFGKDGISINNVDETAFAPATAVSPNISATPSAANAAGSVSNVADQPTGVDPVTGATRTIGGLHFDHTSILKTIARRFMSGNPPYMGPRYADAHDLSSIIGSAMRPPTQFLPFLGYNIVYNSSQKYLDVQGTGNAPGTGLCQSTANAPNLPKFTFEDAGDGFVYIRTHRGNLYVTVARTSNQVSESPTAPSNSSSQVVGIIQNVKYKKSLAPTATTSVLDRNPDYQRWKLSPASPTAVGIGKTQYVITNAFFTGLVLQPASDGPQAGVAVVLAAATAGANPLIHPNAWQVSSPLIPDNSGKVLASNT